MVLQCLNRLVSIHEPEELRMLQCKYELPPPQELMRWSLGLHLMMMLIWTVPEASGPLQEEMGHRVCGFGGF